MRPVASGAVGGTASTQSEPDLAGIVVAGDRRGRELGFPTANVEVPASAVLPPDGVYAGTLERSDGRSYVAAISVGTRPTYYSSDGSRLVEAYLLDFDGDLYGERVRILVLGRVRGQERFDSSEALVAAMQRDIESVRAMAKTWALDRGDFSPEA